MEKRKDINQSGKYVIIDICIIYSFVVREIRVLGIQQVARWDVTKGRVEFYQHVQKGKPTSSINISSKGIKNVDVVD